MATKGGCVGATYARSQTPAHLSSDLRVLKFVAGGGLVDREVDSKAVSHMLLHADVNTADTLADVDSGSLPMIKACN
jgi:hypothetical protein